MPPARCESNSPASTAIAHTIPAPTMSRHVTFAVDCDSAIDETPRVSSVVRPSARLQPWRGPLAFMCKHTYRCTSLRLMQGENIHDHHGSKETGCRKRNGAGASRCPRKPD